MLIIRHHHLYYLDCISKKTCAAAAISPIKLNSNNLLEKQDFFTKIRKRRDFMHTFPVCPNMVLCHQIHPVHVPLERISIKGS